MKKASFSGGFPLWGGALTSMGSKPGGLTKIRGNTHTHTQKNSRHVFSPLPWTKRKTNWNPCVDPPETLGCC